MAEKLFVPRKIRLNFDMLDDYFDNLKENTIHETCKPPHNCGGIWILGINAKTTTHVQLYHNEFEFVI